MTDTPPPDRRAAVIGLGRIGGTVARHLLGDGVATAVFDVVPAAVDPLEELGARRASTASDAATDADLIAIAVVDDDQARAVMTGPDGVLSGARPGAVVAIHSTLRLRTVRELADAAAEHGVIVLDAGVSTVGAGDSDKLALFVGGDAEAVESVRPIFGTYSRDTRYLGELGSGMTAKLVRNLLGHTLMTVAHEALALAETVGMDLDALREVLATAPPAEQMGIILDRPTTRPVTESAAARASAASTLGIGEDDLEAALDSFIGVVEKDLDQVTALADDAGFTLRLAPVARQLVRETLLMPPTDPS